MNISFVLHLYQPSFQYKSVVDRVAKECYIPLIKFIQSHKDLKLTLNMPFSLLELMDKCGHKSWLEDVKNLYKSGAIELTGTGAYHPILPMIPELFAEDEVILNEYGLGYYLGSRQDFEGDPALMLRDLRGFFPPELAVNEFLISLASKLGYDWMLTSKMAVPKEHLSDQHVVYKLRDESCRLVVRDRELSNLISFKRDLDVSEIVSYLDKSPSEAVVVAFDGEFFGHHYKDAFVLFDVILDRLNSMSIEMQFVSELVSVARDVSIDSVNESTWSTIASNERISAKYPLWFDSTNKSQADLYELESFILEKVIDGSIKYARPQISAEDGALCADNDAEAVYMLLHRNLCSDKYWWLSKTSMPAGEYLFSPEFSTRGISYVGDLIEYLGDKTLVDKLWQKYSALTRTLAE